MANFYIDYENVHNEGLKGIELLTPNDTIYLFYSDKADTLKIDVVQKIMQTQGAIRFMKIENGVENALDFQLITALMCDYSADNNYYIISRDKGYDAAITMAQKRERKAIFRCKDINMALKHQNNEAIDESDQDVIIEIDSDEDSQTDIQLADKPDNAAEEPAELAHAAELPEAKPELETVSGDEQAKRAYQSICTKILNTIKINHKVPLNYRQAEQIYKALQESTTKMEFYRMLNRVMGRRDGSELYKKIKSIYKVLRGIYKASVTAGEMAENGTAADDATEQAASEIREINLEGVDCERTMIEIVMEALSEEALAGEDVEAEAAAIVAAVRLEANSQVEKSETEEKMPEKTGRKTRNTRKARTVRSSKDKQEGKEGRNKKNAKNSKSDGTKEVTEKAEAKEVKENTASKEKNTEAQFNEGTKRARTAHSKSRSGNYQRRGRRPAGRTSAKSPNSAETGAN